jgi:hypothetical protein
MKTNLLVLSITAATVLAAMHQGRADQVVVNSVDARIAGGTLANTANLAAAGPIVVNTTTYYGYLEIKAGGSLTSSSKKSYFQFNVGSNLNTNANATFTLVFPTMAPASQIQRVQLWALNQAYAGGFNPTTMTWLNAQANNTNDNSAMLIDPTNTYTATALVSALLPTADASHLNYTFTLQAGTNSTSWGNFVKNGNVTLVLTGIPDSTYNSGGPIRSPTNASTLTFQTPIGGGPMPSISACTNVATYPTVNSPTNYFTVSGSGLALPPYANSDNPAVVADGDIHIEGSGANWKVYAVGGATVGTANIVVTVTDGSGNPANANFKVTVNPVQPSFSSSPPDTNTLTGVALTVPFAVYEPTSNADNITIWATSLNTNLVADAGLSTAKVPGTGGTNRTLTITPLAGTNGIAPIALWASDGVSSNRTAFAVQVRPSTSVVFFDAFAYTTNLTSGGNATITNDIGRLDYESGSFWKIRNGSTPHIFVISGQAQVTYPATATTPESLIAGLVGGPYAPGKGTVLFTKFRATWTAALPSTNSTSIVSLYDETAGSTAGLRGRLSTTNTASGFRVRIQNSEGGLYTEFPQELNVGTTYTIWLKYDLDGAETRLWVDPVSEASPSVLNTDTAPGRTMYDVSLRQATDTGPVLIDDLLVTITNRPILSPVITLLSVSNAVPHQTISFTGDTNDPSAAFTVWHASDVSGPWSDSVAGLNTLAPGSFRATVNDTNTMKFYRVKRY